MGVEIKAVYWVSGPYDNLTIMEAQDESRFMAFAMICKQAGFFTSEVNRGFTRVEMDEILGMVKT
ncbi:MAG: hypothetical protein NVSMB36_25600 [Escherichia coli]